MDFTGTWQVVSSPDFDYDCLCADDTVEPRVLERGAVNTMADAIEEKECQACWN
jgi:hypothetical protein